MQSTLILNAEYEPLASVQVKRAINLIIADKAVSLDNSPRLFRSERMVVPVPYVAMLVDASAEVRKPRRSVFSRRGVLVRDNFTCAYCGNRGTTIDHVVPRALGGPNSYENCVAACFSCNQKKADHTLESLGWKLRFTPSAPSWYTVAAHRLPNNSPEREAWTKYLAQYDPRFALSLI